MILQIEPPGQLDAKKVKQPDSDQSADIFTPRFYKGRKHSYGPTIIVQDSNGNVIDRVAIKISINGKMSMERLTEEIFPEQ